MKNSTKKAIKALVNSSPYQIGRIDVCATEENTKVLDNYFSPEDDGLSKDWQGNVCFMNPPYGREVQDWVKKAHTESLKGTTVVALVPARTDTKWFQYCFKADYLYFVKGRVKFIDDDGNSTGSATFPSVIVVWNHKAPFELNFAGNLVRLYEDPTYCQYQNI